MHTRNHALALTFAAIVSSTSVASAFSNVGTPICLGDGSGPACPCGNFGALGEGCMNSTGVGATLLASNTAGIANTLADVGNTDPVILSVNGLPPGATTIYFQGSNFGFAALGDGMRCIGNPFQVKLSTKFATAGGASSYPGSGDPALSLQGWMNTLLPWPCTRGYQVWYRNAATFCTPFTYNFSSGVEINWV